MRLFLLPVSTRRRLLYCERMPTTQLPAGAKQPLSERLVDRAAKQWTTWEKAEKGWQKQLTTYGNRLFHKLPYEEWGLKSIPPATKQRLEDVDTGKVKFECVFPAKVLAEEEVPSVLRTLATERQSLHRKRMWQCIAWMPVSAPFTLVPVIPNIPFFYLVFRAWSHYRALYGSKLLEHLVDKKLITATASNAIDEIYSRKTANVDDTKEQMLLQKENGAHLAEAFELPEMAIEIERAVEQVEKVLKDQEEKEKKSS